MGMSIEEAIKYFKNKTVVLTEEEALANTLAIETMQKYQKIQDIITRIPYGGDCTVYRIGEVINGNDD